MRTIAGVAGATVGLAAALLLAYGVGHRAGRGDACFQTAVHTPDQAGHTLTSLLLSRRGAKADYSFWGTHCTISIGWPNERGLESGRWAYFPNQARLYAADEPAVRVFPASGRWP